MCACSIIFCFCLLLFPHYFYYSRINLFCSTTCLYLISSCISYCVCHFLWFGFSFLHVIPTVDISFCSLFLFIMFFILVFTHILLYKRILAFVGQIMLTGLKGSWAQFALICRSYSAEELYSATDLYPAADLYSAADLHSTADCFPIHFFIWTFFALRSSSWVFECCF